jgi:Putative addiction module component
MADTIDALQAQVLNLSTAERALLLDRLMASLEADAAIEAEWDEVAAQRDAEVESGLVKPVPLEEVMVRLRAEFPE